MLSPFTFAWTVLLTVASLGSNKTVATNSGTIVVFGYSKNKIVVAADSREKNDDGGYADDQCKITALSNKLAFAANGMTGLWSETPIPYRPIEMHAHEEARHAFDSVRPGADDLVRKIAVLWGENVARIFKEAIKVSGPESVFTDTKQGPFLFGYFAGVSPEGGLVFYDENINRVGNDVSFDPIPKAFALTDTILYGSSGMSDTTSELRQGKTEWAQMEATQWEREAATLPKDDRDVLKAVKWVQLTLDAHPNSHELGGPIDSLTITPDGGLRWNSQKKECK